MTVRSRTADVTIDITSRAPQPGEPSIRAVAAEEPSDRAIAIAGMFGLTMQDLAWSRPAATPATSSTLRCRPGSIVFVTGPSGAGKSCVLASIRTQLAQRDDPISCHLCDMRMDCDLDASVSRAGVRVIDVIGGDLEHAASALARAGLADAYLMVRHVGSLSVGERARLALARLIGRVENECEDGHRVLLIDEFASLLDRDTAQGLARRVRRWIQASACPLSMIVATAHDDLLETLRPDVLVVVDGSGDLDVSYAAADAAEHRAIA